MSDEREDLLKRCWDAERSHPDDLRAAGLTVAVHNDYTLNGERMTFWLMTYPLPPEKVEFRSGVKTIAFKGEGKTDQEALDRIRAQWAEYSDKSHHAPMCPANHYHGQRAPTYRCTCGAAAEAAR